ncbi:MAG: TatD family hydrolase [Clostridia bacterium]|nr:TatD family hydrolase [Clostridia bacterium]
MYVDTHCHLDDTRFNVDEEVNSYLRVGVTKVINVGCNALSSKKGQELSKKHQSIYFGAGFHPSDANDYNQTTEDEIIKLLSDDKCVAVGEIGLDYHWEPYDKQVQQKVFLRQLELASEFKLPVSVHSRDATEDMLKLLKDNKSKLAYGGVMHCFSGSTETAKILLDLGFYLGFGGTVTFKNAKKTVEVASLCPNDRILTETDCPYLSPEPYRGQTNSPKNIPIITSFIAKLKNIDNVEFASIVMKNAEKLFKF